MCCFYFFVLYIFYFFIFLIIIQNFCFFFLSYLFYYVTFYATNLVQSAPQVFSFSPTQAVINLMVISNNNL